MLNTEHLPHAVPERGWWNSDPASNRLAFGMILHQSGQEWVVARVLIGSPAETAGVEFGDKLRAVDDYDVRASMGNIFEMQALMMEDSSSSHSLSFESKSGENYNKQIAKAQLRELLEHDYDNGGSTLGGCVGCRTCRPLTIGATNCAGGCPGDYCTVG